MCEGGDMYIMVEWVQLTYGGSNMEDNGTRIVGASVAVIYYVCCIEGMQE